MNKIFSYFKKKAQKIIGNKSEIVFEIKHNPQSGFYHVEINNRPVVSTLTMDLKEAEDRLTQVKEAWHNPKKYDSVKKETILD